MKKVMIMITAALLLLSTGSFAGGKKYVTAKALSAFAKDFAGASNVSWHEKEDYYLVEFRIGETNFTAAYSEEGELLVSTRIIKLKELPGAVIRLVKEKYPEYELGENVNEIKFEGKVNYSMTVSNSKEILYIKVDNMKQVSEERRIEL